MPHFLKEFFAVTSTSLYRAYVDEQNGNKPIMEKLALRHGAESKRPVGTEVKWIGDSSLVLMMDCIQFWEFIEDEAMHPQYTSHIVALFFDLDDARKCLEAENPEKLDRRWEDQTREVLMAIDEGNPAFFVRWDFFPADYRPSKS